MAGLLEFFQAPFFSRPVKADSFQIHWVVGPVYKLNTMAGTFLFLSSCFVFAKELLRDHIRCIQDGGDEDGFISEEAFNSYCYISSTFTLPGLNQRSYRPAHPGVGPPDPDAETEYHNYYQWVPYLLFLQSLSFFGPLVLHRFLQDGRIQRVLNDLHNIILFPEYREDKYGDIDWFFRDWYNHQTWWATKLVFCDVLNLVVVLLNMFLVDWYLSGKFFSYGVVALGYIFADPEERGPDPFDTVFPKMTKCTMNTYGPSGTIQIHDALCVMTVNVLNEKIYFLVWFILVPLAAFTAIHHLVALIVLISTDGRKRFLRLYISPERPDLRAKLSRILDLTQFGDWMMLYLIAKNTDRVIFGQMLSNLKYPDYHRNVEPLDEENLRLMASINQENGSKQLGKRRKDVGVAGVSKLAALGRRSAIDSPDHNHDDGYEAKLL